MKFANKLEALKWMCRNPYQPVYFNSNCKVWVDNAGSMIGDSVCFNQPGNNNVRESFELMRLARGVR